MLRKHWRKAGLAAAILIAAACVWIGNRHPEELQGGVRKQPQTAAPSVTKKPRIDHIVIVIEENRPYGKIEGNKKLPYMNKLMNEGANLANHFATRHPSQPNYLDLFSGSNQGVKDDKPMHKFTADNLASEMIAHGYTFTGYSDGMPRAGFTGPYDLKTKYARKHNPWVNFTNVPASANQPFTAFPKDYAKLPTVSVVVPSLVNDMHDGTYKQADDWLKASLSGYIDWARTHNSLFILTWDEDDTSAKNHIATAFVGPMVKKGVVTAKTSHYSVLRTIEDLYGLKALGSSKNAAPIDLWK